MPFGGGGYIGELTGRIVLDVSQAVRAYGDVRRSHRALMEDGRQLGISFRQAGTAVAATGATIIGGLVKASLVAADFNKKMDYFGAVTNTNEAEMAKLRDATIKWAQESIFSTNEVADGIVELGKAGVDSQTLINGLGQAIINLGQAADIGMQEASQIMVSTMAQFSLEAEDAVAVADRLSGTANASIIDMRDLGVTMKYAGGISHALGGNLKDLTTAIALLGQAGIKGSTAGTSLRQMMVSLNGSTGPARDAMKELGIITADGSNKFFDMEGKIKPLPQVFQVLQDSLKGYSKQQQTAFLRTIFNNRALTAAAILTKEGANGFKDMNKEIAKTTAADVAAKRLDNLAGDIEILKGNVETFLLQAGTPFQDFLRGIVKALTKVLVAFGNLPEGVQSAILWTVAITGALLVLMGVFLIIAGTIVGTVTMFFRLKDAMIVARGAMAAFNAVKLVGFLGTLGKILLAPIKLFGLLARAIWLAVPAMWAFTAALLANPITWIVLAIVALVVALVILYKKSETVRNVLNALWDVIVSGAQKVWGWITKLGGVFSTLWAKIKEFEIPDWDTIFSGLGNIAGKIGGWLASAVSTIGSWIAKLPGLIGTALANLPRLLGFAIGFVIGFMIRLVILAVTGIINFVTTIWTGLGKLLPMIASWVGFALGYMIGFFIRLVILAVQGIINFVQAIWKGLLSLPALIASWSVQIWTMFVNWLVGLIAWTATNAPKIAAAIVNGIKALPGLVWNFLKQIPAKVKAAVTLAIAAAKAFGKGMITGITAAIKGLPGLVTRTFKKGIAAIKSLIKAAFTAAKNFAKGIWEGFKKGLGIASPSYIERALWAITDTAKTETDNLANQVADIQKLGSKLSDITLSPSTDLSGVYDLAAAMRATDTLSAKVVTSTQPGGTSTGTTTVINKEITDNRKIEVRNPRPERATASIKKVNRDKVFDKAWSE